MSTRALPSQAMAAARELAHAASALATEAATLVRNLEADANGANGASALAAEAALRAARAAHEVDAVALDGPHETERALQTAQRALLAAEEALASARRALAEAAR